ncbi:hypothetical protein evm_014367 [Chilo suppressalis]|nr:hypothetical protein evm_014367 [Chilo suppressalis]
MSTIKMFTNTIALVVKVINQVSIKNFNCGECGSSFYRKADLDRHEKAHRGIKPHTCEICSKSFTQKNNLVMHIKMHVGDRRYECEVCKKRFMTRSKLSLHSRRHDKIKKCPPEHMVVGLMPDVYNSD